MRGVSNLNEDDCMHVLARSNSRRLEFSDELVLPSAAGELEKRPEPTNA